MSPRFSDFRRADDDTGTIILQCTYSSRAHPRDVTCDRNCSEREAT